MACVVKETQEQSPPEQHMLPLFPALQCDPTVPTWSYTYTQGFFANTFCPRDPNCGSACDQPFPTFEELPANLQEVLSTDAAACGPFGGEADAEAFRGKLCVCVSENGDVNPQRQAVTFVLNSLLGVNVVTGEIIEPTEPSTPEECPTAEFVPVRNLYVCAFPGAEAGSCPCPIEPISQWNASVSIDCRDFVAQSADEGLCLPQSAGDLSGSCVLQRCPCEETPIIPDAVAFNLP